MWSSPVVGDAVFTGFAGSAVAGHLWPITSAQAEVTQ
jgi:hypothetical protein